LKQAIVQIGILAGWIEELAVPIYRGCEVTGFTQDETGVDAKLSDGRSLRATVGTNAAAGSAGG